MELYIIFGLPGAGKTFVGKIMQRYFAFYLYDGDQDMSKEYRYAIEQEKVTDELRDKFFSTLISNIRKIEKRYQKIVICQTFIKEKYRQQFKNAFPNTKFILIKSQAKIREKRILKRNEFELSPEKWRRMADKFEDSKVDYTIIYNDKDGEEEVRKQLSLVIASDLKKLRIASSLRSSQ